MTTIDDKKIEKKNNKKKSKKENIFPDGFNENFEGDEEDRNYLQSLTELERENIINDRREKREELKNKMSIEQDYQKQQNSNKTKAGEAKIAKNEMLADIRNKRNQKKEQLLNQRKDKRGRGGESSSESDDDGVGYESRSSDNDGRSNDGEEEQEYGKHKKVKPNEKEKAIKPPAKENTMDQKILEPIILSRQKLVNMVSHKYFDETVKGCFVRIVDPNKDGKNKSHDYMLAQIKDVVVKQKKYKLENKETNKYLVVTHAEKSYTEEINYVSNSAIQDKEFSYWKTHMEGAHLDFPQKSEINRKRDDINRALNYKYEDSEIKKMVDGNISSIIENPGTTIDECNIAINYLEQEKSNLEDEKLDIWKNFSNNVKEKFSKEKVAKELMTRENRPKRPIEMIDQDLRTVEAKLRKINDKKKAIRQLKNDESRKNTSRILEEIQYKNIYAILLSSNDKSNEYTNDKSSSEYKNSRFKDSLESKFHLCESAEAYEETIKDFISTQNYRFSFEAEIDNLPDDDRDFIELHK